MRYEGKILSHSRVTGTIIIVFHKKSLIEPVIIELNLGAEKY